MRISIREVIEAARHNGYEWKTNKDRGIDFDNQKYIEYDEFGNVVTACIYGQAALNLGLDAKELHIAVEHILNNQFVTPYPSIVTYNDDRAISYNDAVDYMEKVFKDFMEEYVEFKTEDV